MTPAPRPAVLVLGADASARVALARHLKEDEEAVLHADAGDRAIALCKGRSVDCVLVLPELADGGGLDLVPRLRAVGAGVVLVIDQGEEATAAEALRAGANEYLHRHALSAGAVARAVRVARQEAALEAELADVRRLVEEMPIGVVLVRWGRRSDAGAARFLWRNRAGAEAVPAPFDFTGMTLAEAFPGFAETDLPAAMARALDTGEIQRLPRLAYADERTPEAVYDLQVIPLRESLLGVVFDNVTDRVRADRERERLQRQLLAGQRMEALGQLAGGVAHDFNNLLTIIHTYAAFARDAVEAEEPRKDLGVVLDAAARAATLTDQLLAFSRRHAQSLEVLHLNDVVRRVEALLRRFIGEDITLVTRLDPDVGRVEADVTQLEQIVMNLVVNARDAMPRGGRILIETSSAHLGAKAAEVAGVAPLEGGYAVISIADTGCGMDAETRARIFEPFFTTKEHGRGTGLGLSTVYGIAKQHGGFVSVDSVPGRGSTFGVHLPRTAAAERRREAAPASRMPIRGTETVLLVEDEAMVRQAAERILTRHGYTVLAAAHPADALLIADGHDGPVHALLTDVVMPGMSGRELADQVERRRPEIAVVFMSGYTSHVIEHHGMLEDGVRYVQKPFRRRALLEAVRRALDDRGESTPPAPTSWTLLVVDDQDLVREVIGRTLERADHRAVCVGSLRGAREAIAREAFDAILCDVQLAGESGHDLVEALAREGHALAQRIILITGGTLDERTLDFSARFPDRVVRKPIERDHLIECVGRLLAGG